VRTEIRLVSKREIALLVCDCYVFLSPFANWHISFTQPDDGDRYVLSVNFCGIIVSIGLSVTSFVSDILV
jgi:hypothetical protein